MSKLSVELRTSIKRKVLGIRAKATKLLAEDAKRQWEQASRGRISPEVKLDDNKAVIGIPLSSDDPQGNKARDIDRSTQASTRVLKNLSTPAYVKGLLQDLEE